MYFHDNLLHVLKAYTRKHKGFFFSMDCLISSYHSFIDLLCKNDNFKVVDKIHLNIANNRNKYNTEYNWTTQRETN